MVSFKSEVIFSLFGFPVTNTVTTTILVDLVILTLIAVSIGVFPSNRAGSRSSSKR
jgi:hypothetical protein